MGLKIIQIMNVIVKHVPATNVTVSWGVISSVWARTIAISLSPPVFPVKLVACTGTL
jgi:hypothetical protein